MPVDTTYLTVSSVNVNGLRAAAKKDPGFVGWLAGTDADVVCLQETRAEAEQLPAGVVALGTYIVGGRVCGTTRRHNPAVDRLWPDGWPGEIPNNRQSVARSL